jgi:hypothetical protein
MPVLPHHILVIASEMATGRELHNTVRAFATDPAIPVDRRDAVAA